MGYMKISNLYKSQDILLFKECYALEKIDGTSSHIRYHHDSKKLTFFSGGSKHEQFISLFNTEELIAKFKVFGQDVIVYGEAYGGKIQGMSHTYGTDLRFIAFEVKVGNVWLDVPKSEKVAHDLGLEFVHYVKVPTTLDAIDAERDAPSVQAVRNGITEPKIREGVILRPIIETTNSYGERIIAKHKRDEFRERATPQKVVDPVKLEVLKDAQAIADEWVTDMRLTHVLQKFPSDIDMSHMRDIIKGMQDDIRIEAAGEVVLGKEAFAAIAKKTAQLFQNRLKNTLLQG